jgi:hypothetical protein
VAVGTGIAHGISFVELKKVEVFAPSGGALGDPWYQFSILPLERKKTSKKKKKKKHGAPAATSDSNAASSAPKGPETIAVASKWIYAYATGDEAHPKIPFLSREFYVDDQGHLSSLDGAKRLNFEVDVAPDPAPVAGAALAHTIQGEHQRYVFIGARGRLCMEAIFSIQQMLTKLIIKPGDMMIFKPQYLQPIDSKTFQALVIDPLTLAESLSLEYQQALDYARAYWIPIEQDPNKPTNEEAEKHRLKLARYQLAKMVEQSLVPPGNPLDVARFLQGNGKDHPGTKLHDFISEVEIEADVRVSRARAKVRTLIAFLKTPLWQEVMGWYLGRDCEPKSMAAKTIGELFWEAQARTQVRMIETREGQDYLQERLKDPNGPRVWFFAPDDDADEAAKEKWHARAPIIRRSMMASTLIWVELAPAIIVYRMVKHPKGVIERTFKFFFVAMEEAHVTEYGQVWSRLGFAARVPIEKVSYKEAYEAIDKWREEKRPAWLKKTRARRVANAAANVFIGVEALNLALQLNDLVDACKTPGPDQAMKKRIAVARVVAGALDLVAASEEPIHEFAHGLAAKAGQKGAAAVVAKLTVPAMFKLVGFAGAVVDIYVHILEAREAKEHGQTQLATAHRVAEAGVGIAALGSALAGVGFKGSFAFLTAASLTLLVIGVVIMAVGYWLIKVWKRTEWQMFAEHCIFGLDNPFSNDQGKYLNDGKTRWSGGEFHEWNAEEEGVALQVKVLTTMMCGFTIVGRAAEGGSSVRVGFGAIPPNGKLQIQFALKYEDGTKADRGYLIDLEKRAVVGTWGPAIAADLDFFDTEHGLGSLTLAFRHPPSPIVQSSCAAIIQYGDKKDASALDAMASGQIPVEGKLEYEIIRDGRHRGRNPDAVNSLGTKED